MKELRSAVEERILEIYSKKGAECGAVCELCSKASGFQNAHRNTPKIMMLPYLTFPILNTLKKVTKEERKAIARFGKEIKAKLQVMT